MVTLEQSKREKLMKSNYGGSYVNKSSAPTRKYNNNPDSYDEDLNFRAEQKIREMKEEERIKKEEEERIKKEAEKKPNQRKISLGSDILGSHEITPFLDALDEYIKTADTPGFLENFVKPFINKIQMYFDKEINFMGGKPGTDEEKQRFSKLENEFNKKLNALKSTPPSAVIQPPAASSAPVTVGGTSSGMLPKIPLPPKMTGEQFKQNYQRMNYPSNLRPPVASPSSATTGGMPPPAPPQPPQQYSQLTELERKKLELEIKIREQELIKAKQETGIKSMSGEELFNKQREKVEAANPSSTPAPSTSSTSTSSTRACSNCKKKTAYDEKASGHFCEHCGKQI